MQRILLLTEIFPPQKGGSGRWLWELYRRLPLKVHVVAHASTGATEFDLASTMPTARIPFKFPTWGLLEWRGVGAYREAWRQLSRLIGELRPASVHCGKALPEGFLALIAQWRYGTSFCCFVHGEELRLAHGSRDLRFLTRQVLRRATVIVANSVHTQTVLRDEWGITRGVSVMTPGVDAARFVPAPVSPGVRARLGWTGRRVILTVGALQKRKGQDMLIRALPAVRAVCPDVLYVMVGDGWEREYLEQLVDEVGVREAIQFREASGDEQLVEYYQQCDVFALPNRQVGWDFEGFGIVLLEAQACEKPVVAGRSGGTSEAFEPGVTGELVACETPEPLARAVTDLLMTTDRGRAMGRRGRELVLRRFDWPVLVRQAMSLFESIDPDHR